MFWRFGGYANISTIDTILEKPDFTLEDLLEETDLIQELKQHNTKLIEYLREDAILKNLLEYVVAPKLEVVETPDDSNGDNDDSSRSMARLPLFSSRPRASSRATDNTETEEEEQEKKRNRYAFVACEILSSDTWSIYEAMTENKDLIREFWKFLSQPVPLDPLQASYFTKVNESLFEKKTDEMMDLLRELPDAVPDLLRHVECPMIMDLLLKIIALDRNTGGEGIVEWLFSKDIIPTLLSCLGPEHSWVVQTAAGDFIKAIITISANASQNEQQCIGPNELTRQLVSNDCVEQLIGYMLQGGNPLTVGVGIIIEVIRKNNSDYDPDMNAEPNAPPSSRDPIYLGTLLRLFAKNVPKFMSLISDGDAKRPQTDSTFGEKLAPLGFDRFKTCELMAELLHCSNMGLLNEPGAEELIAARDVERQRLRAEGKLVPTKPEDMTDDLTMKSQPTPAEEGRPLQVTNNAEDDGFEQVEPSKEMSEDTSHEFVKAEEVVALPEGQSPLSELRGKDEDDLVDEPLSSSPKMAVAVDKIKEQQFEDPDLVVAPLSPSKQKPAEPVLSPQPATGTHARSGSETQPGGEPEPLHLEGDAKKEDDVSSQASSTAIFTPTSSSEPEIKVTAADAQSPEQGEGTDKTRNFSPHPEDTPAPLFSAPPAPESGADQPPVGEEPPTSERPKLQDPANPDPVVGDYLKMQFVEHRVVPTILTFFFKYPWNNFLHNVVYDIVQQVFNGPMDRSYNPNLAVSLFEDADVTLAIIEGQKVSDESQAKTKTRMGYMGHLTLIAEEVVKFTERHPPELLSESVLEKVMSQDWINYVEGALAETRERDNAILGGVRPEVALGHRGSIGGGMGNAGLGGAGGGGNSGSNALAEAGLNGGLELSSDNGGGNGVGPFAIGAGTLMSGFGDSSDEEDEENEGDEDIDSEFRAYNESENASDPPSIPPPPPPPPPLNIPPSRARRQLAARLAMHQKANASTIDSSSSDTGMGIDTKKTTSLLDDNAANSPHFMGAFGRNIEEDEDDDDIDPFADGEDMDEDDDGQHGSSGGGSSHAGRGLAGRGAWWRHVTSANDDSDEDDDDENDNGAGGGDDDDDFGDFAVPEGEGNTNADDSKEGKNVMLKPLAVNPAKEGTSRGVGFSGLWPFGTKKTEAPPSNESGKSSSGTGSNAFAPGAEGRGSANGADREENSTAAPEVKEAKRRTSIEDPDDDDDCAEILAGERYR